MRTRGQARTVADGPDSADGPGDPDRPSMAGVATLSALHWSRAAWSKASAVTIAGQPTSNATTASQPGSLRQGQHEHPGGDRQRDAQVAHLVGDEQLREQHRDQQPAEEAAERDRQVHDVGRLDANEVRQEQGERDRQQGEREQPAHGCPARGRPDDRCPCRGGDQQDAHHREHGGKRRGDQPGREQGEHAADARQSGHRRARRAAGAVRARPARAPRFEHGLFGAVIAPALPGAPPRGPQPRLARTTRPTTPAARGRTRALSAARVFGSPEPAATSAVGPRQGDVAELGPPVEQGDDRAAVDRAARARRSRPAPSPAGPRAARPGRWPRPARRAPPSRVPPTARRRRATGPSTRRDRARRRSAARVERCCANARAGGRHRAATRGRRRCRGRGRAPGRWRRRCRSWCETERSGATTAGCTTNGWRYDVARLTASRPSGALDSSRIRQPGATPRCKAVRVMSTSALPPGGRPTT